MCVREVGYTSKCLLVCSGSPNVLGACLKSELSLWLVICMFHSWTFVVPCVDASGIVVSNGSLHSVPTDVCLF